MVTAHANLTLQFTIYNFILALVQVVSISVPIMGDAVYETQSHSVALRLQGDREAITLSQTRTSESTD